MSTFTPAIVRQCPSCSEELALGVTACPRCHALVYGATVDSLVRESTEWQAKKDYGRARDALSRALTMLPPESTQATWVRDRLQALDRAATAAPVQHQASTPAWAKRLGPLAPIAILLAKGKGLFLLLFKFKFLLSFFSYFAIYATIYGWRFGAGLAVSILIHEMGHFIDIKRRGLPAEMPVFLPGLGAYVKWQNLGVTKRTVAQISLAGPLAGWLAAGACFLIYTYTHDPLWVALGRIGGWLNILNLIPVWALDGGKAMDALALPERVGLIVLSIALVFYARNLTFLGVAAGGVYRLFTKDKPPESDWNTWFYYAAVLFALAAVLRALPLLSAVHPH